MRAGRSQLLLMLGLVVIVSALSARWSPRPAPPVFSDLSCLSIEGIYLNDRIQDKPDALSPGTLMESIAGRPSVQYGV